jgi:hypothetical protein
MFKMSLTKFHLFDYNFLGPYLFSGVRRTKNLTLLIALINYGIPVLKSQYGTIRLNISHPLRGMQSATTEHLVLSLNNRVHKMNQVEMKIFIKSEEITTMDVICGLNATAFNHPGKETVVLK